MRRGLVAGRVVIGLGIGISAAVVPAYLGEVAPARGGWALGLLGGQGAARRSSQPEVGTS